MKSGIEKFAGARILIVDDEPIQRALTRDNLEEAGFCVEEAACGEEAIWVVDSFNPDLLLLDVMMPGIDGFEVCRRLRATEESEHLPIVIVTGREGSADIDEGMAAGATDFLTKPLNWNLLPNRVRYVLRTSRLENELRRSRDLVEKALAAKSILLSTMSHELRTPLNAVIGFADLMRKEIHGPLGQSEYKGYACEIHDSGRQLLGAISAIIDINNIESGIDDLLSNTNYVEEIVQCAVAKTRNECDGAEDATFVFDLHCSNPVEMIDVDSDRFIQGIYHLISNAIKFSPDRKEIHISSCQAARGGIEISVQDNGIGIASDDLERILSPFEQVDNYLTRNFQGLGLGLPLARSIAELHDGSLRIESEVGRGTTATVTLPASRVITRQAA